VTSGGHSEKLFSKDHSSQKRFGMLIFQFAFVAFLMGGGIITLSNWMAGKIEKNALSQRPLE
jgi:hypothetical protein